MHIQTLLLLAASLSISVGNCAAADKYWAIKAVSARGGTGSNIPAPALVTLAQAELPRAYVGQQYYFDLRTLATVSGGNVASIQFGLVSGYLPNGLTLSNEGVVSGRPVRGIAPESPLGIRASYMQTSVEQHYTIKVGHQ